MLASPLISFHTYLKFNHAYTFSTDLSKSALIPAPSIPKLSLSIPTSTRSSSCSSSKGESTFSLSHDDDDGIEIEMMKLGNNSRRIRSSVAINAGLATIWNVLTDYEKLADFIPGLALSQIVEKGDRFARLFQIGQQNLAFGLKFNAKGVVDCYEKDLENLPFGQRRDIEFKMIEGDFEIFEGRWSIEQYDNRKCEGSVLSFGQEFNTTLWYVVDVKPKLWLPVHFVEGILCREIRSNLSCIREEAQKSISTTLPIE